MLIAGAGFASVPMASRLIDPGASNDEARQPITTELNGVDIRLNVPMNTLEIDDTLGQQVRASMTLIDIIPVPGDQIRML